jgi:hypothetical protein
MFNRLSPQDALVLRPIAVIEGEGTSRNFWIEQELQSFARGARLLNIGMRTKRHLRRNWNNQQVTHSSVDDIFVKKSTATA